MDDRNWHKPSDPVAGLCRMAFFHRVSAGRRRSSTQCCCGKRARRFPCPSQIAHDTDRESIPAADGEGWGVLGSILEQFSVGVGASVADPIVAKLISPEALLDLLQSGRLSGVFPDNVPPIEGLSSEALGNVWRVYPNSELGIARFFVTIPIDKPPVESFRLGSCLTRWRWKLCSAELPEQLQLRLAKEIAKSEQR